MGRHIEIPRSPMQARGLAAWAGLAAHAPRAFTLLELLIVLAVLAVLAGSVVALFGNTQEDASDRGARVNLIRVRDAIMGLPERPGYFSDMRTLPQTMADLFRSPGGAAAYDPSTRIGWRGPYMLSPSGTYTVVPVQGFSAAYGADGDPALLDPWGRPIVIQAPTVGTMVERSEHTRAISAGPNGIVETPAGQLYPAPSQRGDDLVLFLRRADVP